MPNSDGSILLSVSVDTKDLDASMKTVKEKTSTALKNAGLATASAVGNTIKSTGLAAVKGATALAQTAVKSTDNFADYEQLSGGVETLFKDSADTVKTYAESAYETAGLSANEYLETVTGFSASLVSSLSGDTQKAAEKANTAVTDMADNANKMGTNVKSLQKAYSGFAKQNYTMLDNLKLGYGGNKAEMQRLLEDAEKLSGIKYDISDFSDVTDAIHIIQTEMGITGTTSKEAEETISGSANAMSGAFENLKTGLSDPNADVSLLVKNLADSTFTYAENILPALTNGAMGIAEALPAVVDEFLPKITQMLPTVLSSFSDLVLAVVEKLPDILSDIIEVLPQIIGDVLEVLPELIPGVVTALAEGIGILCENFGLVINPLIETLPEILTLVMTAVIDNLPVIVSGLVSLVSAIVEALPQIILGLLTAMKDVALYVGTALEESLLPRVKEAFSSALDKVKEIWNTVKEYFEGVWNSIKEVFSVTGEVLSGFFGSGYEKIKEVFATVGEFFSSVWENIKGAFLGVKEFFASAFQNAFDALTGVFSGTGEFFSSVWDTVKQSFSQIGNAMGEAVSGSFSKAVNYVLEKACGLINGFIKSINTAIGVINKIPGVEIPKLKKLDVPALARGAVLPANKPFLAVVGDQKRGTNVEAPAELIKQMAKEAIYESGGTGTLDIKELLKLLDGGFGAVCSTDTNTANFLAGIIEQNTARVIEAVNKINLERGDEVAYSKVGKSQIMKTVYNLAQGGERIKGNSLVRVGRKAFK